MNVLVVCGLGLGNMIHATPLVRALKDAGTSVSVLIETPNYPGIDAVFKDWDAVDMVYIAPAMMAKRFDFIVSTFAVAHRDKAKLSRQLGAKAVRCPCDPLTSEAVNNVNVMPELGLKIPDVFPKPQIPISDNDFGVFDLGFHCGCMKGDFWQRKHWPGFADLARTMPHLRIAVVGTAGEGTNASWPDNCFDMTEMALPYTAAIIRACKVFVSNDSGLLHMAAATGVPTVGIFGATSEKKAMMPSAPFTAICGNVPCRPCRHEEKRWRACRDWKCINSISVEVVRKKIEEALGAK